MNDELRDSTGKVVSATGEPSRAKEDILALHRWEDEGGRVRQVEEDPPSALRSQIHATSRIHA